MSAKTLEEFEKLNTTTESIYELVDNYVLIMSETLLLEAIKR